MKLSLFERIARKRHVDVSVENIDTTNKMDGDMERGLQLQNTLGESDLWEEGSFESGGEDSSEDESKQDNPFAPREGKTLTWRSINMILNKNNDKRVLLDNVWGEIPKQKITAILGPSGAGKTSLLNILAGRARSRGIISISSDIRLNNYPVDPTKMNVRKQIAFVAQDDSLQITSTPRECIRFSAKLRLSRTTSDGEIDKLVETMLAELGLSLCADTLVGGPLLKGISGGERKRTSVGVELVVKPSLVFLDEPTSGLDSYSALQVVQVLKKVANAGASVLFTIHQPSSEVFNSFDNVILMNKGRVMYEGEVSNLNDHFSKRGHPVPPNYNPSDWIMHLAQAIPIADLEEKGFFPADTRECPNPATDSTVAFPKKDKKVFHRVNWVTQTSLLLQRDWMDMIRNKRVTGARYAMCFGMSFLVALLYQNVGRSPKSDIVNFQSHFGALLIILLVAMFASALPALLTFPDERPVFLREYSTNHYSVFSYFISKFTMEAINTFIQVLLMLLIVYWMIGFKMNFFYLVGLTYAIAMSSAALGVLIGSGLDDPKMGYQLMPIVYIPQILLSGFFVNAELIPKYLRFLQFLCPLTFALRLGLIAEFSTCGISCDMFRIKLNARVDDAWWYWLALIALFISCRFLALYILKKKATRFL